MDADFQLVDTGWTKVLDDALLLGHAKLRIVCPFIKRGVTERILRRGKSKNIQVITRFNLSDFYDGVSDIAALRLLMEKGAQVRGVRNLHAKLYLFGETRVIVTSANLTDAALQRNQEFGFMAENAKIIDRCVDYFEDLWGRAGKNLSFEQLISWENRLSEHLAHGTKPHRRNNLGDEGTDIGNPPPSIDLPLRVANSPQSFVKFFGISSDRASHSMPTLEEVDRSGCHWACTYPKGKRPRQVQDGAVMYMGRLVKDPNDILIYGRAIALKHIEGRDDATADDINLRTWKRNWPHYIRVHHPEFVAGILGNGISLNELMLALQANAFTSTQNNATSRTGNTDPRKAYMQKPAVQLSFQGVEWLNTKLDAAFTRHGRLLPDDLEQLDWPRIPLG
jgi:hypothetical protein